MRALLVAVLLPCTILHAQSPSQEERARRAQAVLERWGELRPVLARIEALSYDESVSDEDRASRCAECWKEVVRFEARTPRDRFSQSTMLAVTGWPLALQGRWDEARGRARAAFQLAPDLPYGPLLDGMIDLLGYLRRQRFEGGAPVAETAEMASIRERVCMDVARMSSAWTGGPAVARQFQTAFDAAYEAQAGRTGEALRGVALALDQEAIEPLRRELFELRARIHAAVDNDEAAAEDWGRVAEARPRSGRTQYELAWALYRAATRRGAEEGEARDALVASIEACDRCAELAPDRPAHWAHARGLAYMALGRRAKGDEAARAYEAAIEDSDRVVEADPSAVSYQARAWCLDSAAGRAGLDEEEFRRLMDRVIDDLSRALEIASDRPAVLRRRARALVRRAWKEWPLPRDARPYLDRALRDYDEALQANPRDADMLAERGDTRVRLGYTVERHRGDPTACWDAALADLGAALRIDPRSSYALYTRGRLLRMLGRFDDAIRDLEACLAVHPENVLVEEELASAKALRDAPWGRDLALADRVNDRYDYQAGRAAYEKILPLVTPEQKAQPALRKHLASAHYDLACTYSLLSMGKGDPQATPRPVTEAAAAEWRDRAFERLRSAIALGWHKVDHALKDGDLVPLHDDPRWQESIEAMKKAAADEK